MKNTFKKIMLFTGAFMLMLASCKKDEVLVTANEGTVPSLTADAATVTLTQATAADKAIKFNWTASDFGYNAEIKYTIEFAIKGTNFSKIQEVSAGTALEKTMTQEQLNGLIGKLNEDVLGQTVELEARLVAKIGTQDYKTVSSIKPLMVKTYTQDIFYPSLYVAGDYEGWSPSTAPRVSTGQPEDTKIYSGYIYVAKATGTPFKFTSNPDWDHTNYGLGTSTGTAGNYSGTLGSGDNLTIAEAGYYKLDADLNANTWSATKTDWAVVGDATPGNWPTDTSAPYQVMTYDATSQTFSITLSLVPGGLKFRANNGWTLNYGAINKDVVTQLSGKLKAGGEDIKITEAGNYKIIFNLSVTGNYKYKIVKI